MRSLTRIVQSHSTPNLCAEIMCDRGNVVKHIMCIVNRFSEEVCMETISVRIVTLYIIVTVLTSALVIAQSTEFLLDTNVTYKATPSKQSYPAIIYDGANYFVVWHDWRNKISYYDGDSYYSNIYGCRVTPEGVVLDSAGIPISYYVNIAGYLPCAPGIAYGNGVFFVTWSDFRQGLGGDIYGARIDTNGIVLDPSGFEISTIPDVLQSSPCVAFDGTNFLVVWYDQRTSFDIYGCRVSPDGTVLDTGGILIAEPGDYVAVSVAFDGINYLVVWGGFDDSDIRGVRVDTAGVVLDTSGIPICTASSGQSCPRVTFGNKKYFVVWQDDRSGINNADIYGARVDTSGVVLDTNGFAISSLPADEWSPSVVFNGTNYLATWSDYAHVYCARVDTGGVVLDPDGIIVSQDTTYEDHSASVASHGSNYLIVWFTEDIRAARVDTTGIVVDTTSIILSLSAYAGQSSSASFDGTNYFAVWEDYRDSLSAHVYGTRIDSAGTILDADGILLIDGAHPAIAYDGSKYLAVCTGINGVQIDTAGNVIDTVLINAGGRSPAIIFGENDYFVVWNYASDICGARVDTAGTVLDTNAIIIAHGEYYEDCPSVAFDGANYFVVWQYTDLIIPYGIYGARVDTAGILLDTISIPIAAEPWSHCCPSVAFDGTNYIVVWEDHRNGNADIYGTRVSIDGVVLDTSGLKICTAPSAQYAPRVVFDGKNYCVIWEDWRNENYTDIYGCSVAPSGIILEEFTVSTQPNLQIEPALVKGVDKLLITFTGFVDSISGHPTNTMRIWGTLKPVTGIVEDENREMPTTPFEFEVVPELTNEMFHVRFHSTDECTVTIKMYDVMGRLVKKVFEGKMKNGRQEMLIVPYDLSAGIYFVRLETARYEKTEKVILLH